MVFLLVTEILGNKTKDTGFSAEEMAIEQQLLQVSVVNSVLIKSCEYVYRSISVRQFSLCYIYCRSVSLHSNESAFAHVRTQVQTHTHIRTHQHTQTRTCAGKMWYCS